MKRPMPAKWLVIAGAVLLIAVLFYLSRQQTRYHYEVCVNFKGASHCARAAGATAEEAIHAAHDIDCANLSNGRDENMVCLDTQPSSIRSLR